MLFHCGCYIQPWRLSLGDQLRQPGVVYVAAQIPGLNVAVPEAGHDHKRRHDQHSPPIAPQEPQGVRDCAVLVHHLG